MKLTNDDVQDILQLLNASGFEQMHLQTDRFKLSLRRSGDGAWAQAAQDLSAPNLLQSVAAVAPPTAPAAAAVSKSTAASIDGLIEVRTPLLGTFYRASKPGSPPFVEVGSLVEKDSVVGIVETMKLMNSVYAGVRGKVVEICLNNAEFAEHDAVLMRVQPEAL